MHKETKILEERTKEGLEASIDEHINDREKKWKFKGGISVTNHNMGFNYCVTLTRTIKD